MASDSNTGVPTSIPEVQSLVIVAHPKDLEHKNNIKDCQKESDLRYAIVSEHSSESPSKVVLSSGKEQANYIKCPQDDPAIESFEENLHVAASLSKEANGVGKNSTENQAVSNSKKFKDQPLSKKVNTILSGLSEGNESSEIILPSLSEETESSAVIHPSLSEETKSSEVSQPYLSEETESSEVHQSSPSEETESSEATESADGNHASVSKETKYAEVNHASFSEKYESAEVNQAYLSEEAEFTKEIHPVEKIVSTREIHSIHSEEAELNQVNEPVILKEVNLNKVTTFHSLETSWCSKAQISLSDFEIPASNEKSDPLSESASDITSTKSGEIQNNSEFPNALDTEEFLSQLKTPEYENATHLVLPGGQVIIARTPPAEPITPLEYLQYIQSFPSDDPSSELTKYLSPTKDAAVGKNIFSTPLFVLVRKFEDWMIECTKWISEDSQHSNRGDFIDYLKNKFLHGINLLKQMNFRMSTLLTAVHGLPDSTTVLPHAPKNETISIYDSLVSFGLKLQGRLRALEAEVFRKYEGILSDAERFETKFYGIVARKAKDLFDKLTEDFKKLCVDVKNFRKKIKDFCLEIHRFL